MKSRNNKIVISRFDIGFARQRPARTTTEEATRLLVNAMGGSDHPLGVYQHTPAPMADETEFRMQQLKRHLPWPRAPLAGLAVENTSGGGGSRRRRISVLQYLYLRRHNRTRLPL